MFANQITALNAPSRRAVSGNKGQRGSWIYEQESDNCDTYCDNDGEEY